MLHAACVLHCYPSIVIAVTQSAGADDLALGAIPDLATIVKFVELALVDVSLS